MAVTNRDRLGLDSQSSVFSLGKSVYNKIEYLGLRSNLRGISCMLSGVAFILPSKEDVRYGIWFTEKGNGPFIMFTKVAQQVP